jgi:hypothetical protein
MDQARLSYDIINNYTTETKSCRNVRLFLALKSNIKHYLITVCIIIMSKLGPYANWLKRADCKSVG